MSAADPVERFRLSDQYQTLKSSVHRHLIAQIEDRKLDIYTWTPDKVERFVAEQVRRYVLEQRLPVNQRESEALIEDARNELLGFGPIQSLVDDDTVNDIVVNGPNNVFIERAGRLYSAPVRFNDDNHVIRVIQRILAPLGRRVDESTPMVDARLPDGSSSQRDHPADRPRRPLPVDPQVPQDSADRRGSAAGAAASPSRKSPTSEESRREPREPDRGWWHRLGQDHLPEHAEQLDSTEGERIVTVEDAAELRLRHNHVVRLETRPPNLEGQRAITCPRPGS